MLNLFDEFSTHFSTHFIRNLFVIHGVKLLFNIGVIEFGVVVVEFVIFQLNFFLDNMYFIIFNVKNKNKEKHKAMYPILLIITFTVSVVESDISLIINYD